MSQGGLHSLNPLEYSTLYMIMFRSHAQPEAIIILSYHITILYYHLSLWVLLGAYVFSQEVVSYSNTSV